MTPPNMAILNILSTQESL